MKWKTLTSILLTLSMIVTTFTMAPASSPSGLNHCPRVDQLWWPIIIPPDAQLTALLTHMVDAGHVPRPTDLPVLSAAGFTITSVTDFDMSFLATNCRVHPFDDVAFRQALARLIDKETLVLLYTDPISGTQLKDAMDYWLPPGQAKWIDTETPLPTYDPVEAASILDSAGYIQGTTANPYYDPTFPSSAPYLRIDPATGTDMQPFEYYVIGPMEDPIGFHMAIMITSLIRKMGLSVTLVPATWMAMLVRYVNEVLDDWQMMSGLSLEFDKRPVFYEIFESTQQPLWNLWGINDGALDYWCHKMKLTLDQTEEVFAARMIQKRANELMPLIPMFVSERYMAYTHDFTGIVKTPGDSQLTLEVTCKDAIRNRWVKMIGGSGRTLNGMEIATWIMPEQLFTLNPLTANGAYEWQVLDLIYDRLIEQNPCTHEFIPWIASDLPTLEDWIGLGENGVYDAPVTYDPVTGELATYNSLPVADVTQADLVGDDTLGMTMTFTLRDDVYWHDGQPVTAEDCVFALNLLRYQQNVRYRYVWQPIYDVELLGPYTFKVCYQQRHYWASKDISDVALLCPKHIWEPFIAGPDGELWTPDDRHHSTWLGWEELYIEDPLYPGQYFLSYLIGCGPFIYHYGGWVPGVSVHLEANCRYPLKYPGVGSISGTVTLTCFNSPVAGVQIDLYDSTGLMIASTTTAQDGTYSFQYLQEGNYIVTIVPNAVYTIPAGQESVPATVVECHVTIVDFVLQLKLIDEGKAPRTIGYWKHQVNAWLAGKGEPHETLEDLTIWLGIISDMSSIFEFTPSMELQEAQVILNIGEKAPIEDRARQQLLALWLNVISGKLATHTTIDLAEFGLPEITTVSKAILYCEDNLVANPELVKDIADAINNGLVLV